MRTPRNAIMAAPLVLGVILLSIAPPASGVTVRVEANAALCGAITPPTSHGAGTGGCPFRLTSASKTEVGSALGMTMCDTQFEGKLNSEGEGYIYSMTITNCSPAFNFACGSPEQDLTKLNWPAEFTTETNMEWTICLTVFGITLNCHLPSLTVTQNAAHGGTVSTGASHQFCETSGTNSIQGTWNLVVDAAHPAFEPVG